MYWIPESQDHLRVQNDVVGDKRNSQRVDIRNTRGCVIRARSSLSERENIQFLSLWFIMDGPNVAGSQASPHASRKTTL